MAYQPSLTMAAASSSLISTGPALKEFLSSIQPASTLYVDLEGKDLSRHGILTLITILVQPHNVTRVVDVLSLEHSAFSIESDDGTSLKSILEDPAIPKYVRDVRNDADALWARYQVKLAGVIDIQLLENASRPDYVDRNRLSGLDKAVEYDIRLGHTDRQRWLQTKSDIKKLMRNDIFSTRPLAPSILRYCLNDVVHLPTLHEHYVARITREWSSKVLKESQRRLDDARSPGFQPQSPGMVFGPWGRGPSTGLSLEEMAELLWDHERENDYNEGEEDSDWDDDDVRCSADVDDFGGAFD